PEAQGVVVGLDEAAHVDVEDDDGLRRVLDLDAVPLLALPEGLGGAATVGDVDGRADVALEDALGGDPRHARVHDPPMLPGLSAEAVPLLVGPARPLEPAQRP